MHSKAGPKGTPRPGFRFKKLKQNQKLFICSNFGGKTQLGPSSIKAKSKTQLGPEEKTPKGSWS